jgi:hypothetical protein
LRVALNGRADPVSFGDPRTNGDQARANKSKTRKT